MSTSGRRSFRRWLFGRDLAEYVRFFVNCRHGCVVLAVVSIVLILILVMVLLVRWMASRSMMIVLRLLWRRSGRRILRYGALLLLGGAGGRFGVSCMSRRAVLGRCSAAEFFDRFKIVTRVCQRSSWRLEIATRVCKLWPAEGGACDDCAEGSGAG